jgi:UV DNA damage endonuclease
VVAQSVAELVYHGELLDLMELDHTHKIQIHVGGVYGDKAAASARFVSAYGQLPGHVRARLVIENDERQYALADALAIHRETGVPVLFDIFHHRIFNAGESLDEALDVVVPTWQGHGPAMLEYSSQHAERQVGAHTESIDLDDFAGVLDVLEGRDVDVMLEIKDKEASDLAAIGFADARGLPITRPRATSLVPGHEQSGAPLAQHR